MKKISSGLKNLFLFHLVAGLVFGLSYIFIPNTMMGWFGVTLPDVFPWQIIGAAILGFSASSWYCYKESEWERVRIVVLAELVWTGLVVLVGLYGLFVAGQPAIMWTNVFIMAIFFVSFAYFYKKH